ncbi:MAG: transcriptional repressor [Anaerolineae bacterium]|nr:transcriptional repressor [Anaerolineae bacterium]
MDQLNSIIGKIKANGERVTLQRRIVIEAMCNLTGHVTIQNIRTYIQHEYKEQDLSDTTIYRILQWLKQVQLVAETDIGADAAVYQLLTHPHHHLICLSCGGVTELEDAQFDLLRQELNNKYGFKARIDHLAIFGQCRHCAE